MDIAILSLHTIYVHPLNLKIISYLPTTYIPSSGKSYLPTNYIPSSGKSYFISAHPTSFRPPNCNLSLYILLHSHPFVLISIHVISLHPLPLQPEDCHPTSSHLTNIQKPSLLSFHKDFNYQPSPRDVSSYFLPSIQIKLPSYRLKA